MNIPRGYKLVPVEPTEEMQDVGATYLSHISFPNIAVKIYKNMLAAAPTPPQPIYDEAKELANCRANWEKTGVGVVFADYWAGWQARAKSVEVGDE